MKVSTVAFVAGIVIFMVACIAMDSMSVLVGLMCGFIMENAFAIKALGK